jgi:Ca2+-binding RTX toxin-like protein
MLRFRVQLCAVGMLVLLSVTLLSGRVVASSYCSISPPSPPTEDFSDVYGTGAGYVGSEYVVITKPQDGCHIGQTSGLFLVVFGTGMASTPTCADYSTVVQTSSTAVRFGSPATPDSFSTIPGKTNLAFGFSGFDIISVDDASYVNIIYAGGGDDEVYYDGGSGGGANPDQIIFAGPGDDTVSGSPGQDLIIGREGADTITGEGQDDTIWAIGAYSSGALDDGDDMDGGDGADTYIGGGGDDGIIDTGSTGSGETVIAGGGDDSVSTGDSNDLICGGDGSDSVEAFGGADVIYLGDTDSTPELAMGMDGNDTIYGGDGSDYIHGGEGTDYLYGESGVDQVWACDDPDYQDGHIVGGPGDDLFYVDPDLHHPDDEYIDDLDTDGNDNVITSVCEDA